MNRPAIEQARARLQKAIDAASALERAVEAFQCFLVALQRVEREAVVQKCLRRVRPLLHGRGGEAQRGRKFTSAELDDAEHLQRVEIQPLLSGDHDFPVDDAPGRERIQEDLVEIRQISIERPEVAALDDDAILIAVAGQSEYECAETVPFRFVQKSPTGRYLIGHFREHGCDGRTEHDPDYARTRGP